MYPDPSGVLLLPGSHRVNFQLREDAGETGEMMSATLSQWVWRDEARWHGARVKDCMKHALAVGYPPLEREEIYVQWDEMLVSFSGCPTILSEEEGRFYAALADCPELADSFATLVAAQVRTEASPPAENAETALATSVQDN